VAGVCPSVSFRLDGRNIVATRATEYKKMSCGQLRDGLRIEVRGKPRADGSVVAQKIERR
jgi:hypothetical protein